MKLRVEGFVWRDWVIEKIIDKHNVEPFEVEEVFFNPPYHVRRGADDKYLLYGRSNEGRYLLLVFAWEGKRARIITAREMTRAEKRLLDE